VAVPFAIGMWVLGVFVVKIGIKIAKILIVMNSSVVLFISFSLFRSGERLAEIIGLVP
jgi:hypothetical protein